MANRGLFITFEGTEGSGKTTQAELLAEWLAKKDPVLVCEPGGPALAAGQVVIADRYHDSTLAYQGGARGLPTTWPPSFPRPDITFLFVGDVEAGLGRHAAAGKSKDRMERESIEFHRKVAEAYERLAAAEPNRFVRLDATGSRDKIQFEVRDHLKRLGIQ